MSFDGDPGPRRRKRPSGEPEVAIRVRHLTNKFGNHYVHKDLELDVYKGEVIGVVGPSGTGKSVLLRSIVGLNKPSSAEVEVFGQRIDRLNRDDRVAVERRWGVMFQDGGGIL